MEFANELLLNRGWRFALTEQEGVELEVFDDSGFSPVDLPHDWQIDNPRDPDMPMGWSQGHFPRNQLGWYRLAFHADAAWQGKAVRLVVDGCQRFYQIYLNGTLVGGKRYGYVPYVCDLSGQLRLGGDNLLCVRVDNRDGLGDRWYSGAGLYRGVRLLVDEPAHFVPWGLAVTSELRGTSAALHIHAELENRLARPVNAEVRASLIGPDGARVAQCVQPVALAPGQTEISLSMDVADAQRWDIDDPALYQMELALVSDGAELDRVRETVGFRDFAFDGDRGFLLNGRARKLYGANLHHDGGLCFGAAVPPGVLRRRLLKLREMGCNAIRCSHNPHAEELYALCDELGLVVIDELYDKWNGSELYFNDLYDQDWRDDLAMMVRRDRNHPCVVLWSMGNELEIQYTDAFYSQLQAMCDACRTLDPTRPVSLALVGFCTRDFNDETPLITRLSAALRYAEIVDVFMGNYMEGFYRALRDAGLNKAVIGSEVFSYYRNSELTWVASEARSPWVDVEAHSWVCGGFVWAGVDYLGESGHFASRGWAGCPIDSAGFHKLRAWHLQSQWSKRPMIKIGVFDENDPWDMANANWGFPQMSSHWSFQQKGRMMHVAVMTNCDEVRLYLNEESVRVGKPDSPDHMAHFYLPFRPGRLSAVGYSAGEAVCEQLLLTAQGPHRIALRCEDALTEHSVAHVEADLLDEHGQLWTQTSPEIIFEVRGARLIGADNGDLIGEHDVHSGCVPFHLGHALAYLRSDDSDCCTVTARCGDMRAELVLSAEREG